jgi:hypothetical protein
MKTGDLILWHGNKWRWRLWRWITKSARGHHVSTVIRLKEYEKCDMRVFILETRWFGGAALNLLSRKLTGFHGEVSWYPLIDEWNPYREIIGETMLKLVGEPYDAIGIVEETFWRLIRAKITMFIKKIGKYLGLTWKCVRQGRWYENLFCSEYCLKGYVDAGLVNKEEVEKKIKGSPLPADLLELRIFQPCPKGIQIYKGTSLWEILYRQLIGQEKISYFPTQRKQDRLRL